MEEAPTLESKEQSPASLLKLLQEKSNESWYIKMGAEICDMVEHFQDWDTDNIDYKETQFIRQLLWKIEDYSFYIRREIRQKNYLPIKIICVCTLPFIIEEDIEDISFEDDRVNMLAEAINEIFNHHYTKNLSNERSPLFCLKRIFLYIKKHKTLLSKKT